VTTQASKINSSKLDEYVTFANELADIGRAYAVSAFEQIAPFYSKGDGSPVTAADLAIEEEIINAIKEKYPEHGILGEESGVENLDREFVWVIDPIDGTKSFATGTSTFGSLIALCRYDEPVVGVIELPVSGWRYVGAKGQATTFNGTKIKSRARTSLSDCILSASGGEFFRGTAPFNGFENLRARSEWTVYGAGCSAYGSLSRGLIDICLDGINLATFDYCALVPVVEGAGGRITDWNGNAFRLAHDLEHRTNGVIASGDWAIHDKALASLNGDIRKEI